MKPVHINDSGTNSENISRLNRPSFSASAFTSRALNKLELSLEE